MKKRLRKKLGVKEFNQIEIMLKCILTVDEFSDHFKTFDDFLDVLVDRNMCFCGGSSTEGVLDVDGYILVDRKDLCGAAIRDVIIWLRENGTIDTLDLDDVSNYNRDIYFVNMRFNAGVL